MDSEVLEMETNNVGASKSIDVKGQICPYPIIATRAALKELGLGQVLEVITDNPPTALETLPQFCESKGYGFERLEPTPGVWRCYVRKMG
jgi:tRNA 2-thiouridine synthesizing protein A